MNSLVLIYLPALRSFLGSSPPSPRSILVNANLSIVLLANILSSHPVSPEISLAGCNCPNLLHDTSTIYLLNRFETEAAWLVWHADISPAGCIHGSVLLLFDLQKITPPLLNFINTLFGNKKEFGPKHVVVVYGVSQ